MQILLAAATELEIAPFLKENSTTDFLITGVGSPSSIYQLTKRLHQIDYDLVIQAGIAGSFTRSLQLGEVVLVKEDHFADVGIMEQGRFYTVFEKGFTDGNVFPFAGGWLRNEGHLIDELDLPKVKAVTVNTVSDDEMQINRLVSGFHPGIETMEGAALHYVCLHEEVPFLQLRSISNYVGERDKTNWKMKESIDQLNDLLKRVISGLLNPVQK